MTAEHFVDILNQWPPERIDAALATASDAGDTAVKRALRQGGFSAGRLAALLSPAAQQHLEPMAQASAQLTRQRFGRAMQLYAPLYVSNYCINSCRYCGFNCRNQVERRALTLDEAESEAERLRAEGFAHILIVAGEDPGRISVDYLAELAQRLKTKFCSVNLEVHPLSEPEYRTVCQAGVDSLTLYQETYERDLYAEVHPAGPKRDFDWRLDTVERGARAGIQFLGIGALLGLGNWRREAFCLALHARHLQQRYWRRHVSVSLPRMRDAAGLNTVPHPVADRHLVQMMCALRLLLPDVGLVLSTRENADFRDHVLPLGITRLSAGSRTSPGGYSQEHNAEGQFEIADHRSPREVKDALRAHGFDPVEKDWDSSYSAAC